MSAYLTHVTGPGERWDHIAYRYYGDATRRGELLRANLGTLVPVLGVIPPVLPANVEVRVPVLAATTPDIQLPPWKRKVV